MHHSFIPCLDSMQQKKVMSEKKQVGYFWLAENCMNVILMEARTVFYWLAVFIFMVFATIYHFPVHMNHLNKTIVAGPAEFETCIITQLGWMHKNYPKHKICCQL